MNLDVISLLNLKTKEIPGPSGTDQGVALRGTKRSGSQLECETSA